MYLPDMKESTLGSRYGARPKDTALYLEVAYNSVRLSFLRIDGYSRLSMPADLSDLIFGAIRTEFSLRKERPYRHSSVIQKID